MRLLALGLVGDLELAIGDAGLGLELLGAVEHAFVEGLVELAADVEDDGGLVVCRESSGRRHGNGGDGGEQITSYHCSLPDRFGGYNHIAIRVAIPFFIVGSRPAGRRRPAA